MISEWVDLSNRICVEDEKNYTKTWKLSPLYLIRLHYQAKHRIAMESFRQLNIHNQIVIKFGLFKILNIKIIKTEHNRKYFVVVFFCLSHTPWFHLYIIHFFPFFCLLRSFLCFFKWKIWIFQPSFVFSFVWFFVVCVKLENCLSFSQTISTYQVRQVFVFDGSFNYSHCVVVPCLRLVPMSTVSTVSSGACKFPEDYRRQANIIWKKPTHSERERDDHNRIFVLFVFPYQF